jgi:hypothetical protein
MNLAATNRYPASALVAVLEIITKKYNNKELSIARLDAKYGQCQFTTKFFANPEIAMIAMLGRRHISNIADMKEIAAMDDWDGEAEGFSCPVNFQDYLLEVVESSFH